jgi:hypothetical protein
MISSQSKIMKINSFHGAGKVHKLICQDDKIVVPTKLQKPVVQWYHTQLCHPGTTRTEETIRQHFTWKGLRPIVKDTSDNMTYTFHDKDHTWSSYQQAQRHIS